MVAGWQGISGKMDDKSKAKAKVAKELFAPQAGLTGIARRYGPRVTASKDIGKDFLKGVSNPGEKPPPAGPKEKARAEKRKAAKAALATSRAKPKKS